MTGGIRSIGFVVACALAGTAPATSTHAGEAPVSGTYVNRQYGFRVTIPPPLQAWRAAAPAPDHGVRVDLGPTRSIVVAAAFDAADYGSTDNLLDATLRGYHAVAARRGTVQIAGRTASQAAFTSAGVPAVVIAQQTGPATERINLTLALTTDVAHERRDHVTLGKIARSFRWTPRS